MAETKEDETKAVRLAPIQYEPDYSGNEVKYDVENMPSTRDFTSIGVICGCKPHAPPFHNRANFKFQHLQTKIHKNWLIQLTKDKPNLLKREKENLARIKDLQIREGKMRQVNIKLDKQIGEYQKKLIQLECELDEVRNRVSEYEEIYNCKNKIIDILKKEKSEIEKLWYQMGSSFGYEITENDEE